jgi:hypothetical protein
MELTFTYTLEEFREGLTAVRKPIRVGKRKSRESLWVGLTTGVLLFALLIVAALTQQMTANGEIVPTFASSVALSLIPWTLIIGIAWSLFVPRMDEINQGLLRKMLMLMIFAGLLGAVIGGWNPSLPPPPPQKPATLKETLLPFIPWLLIFAILWIGIYRILRGLPKRMWDGQPNMKLPQAVKISNEALEMDSAAMRTVYQWSAFVCYRETKNLFLLQPSKLSFVIIPKRACADAGAVEALRRMVELHVPNAEPKPFGFTVTHPPPPLPPPRMVESLPPREML